MFEEAVKLWVRWQAGVDEREIKRACGVKPYGIEYRLMLAEGTVQREASHPPPEIIYDIDTAWLRIKQFYPDEMDAVKIYYQRKCSYRAVREAMGISQHMSRKLVIRGGDLLRGGLYSLMGFNHGQSPE